MKRDTTGGKRSLQSCARAVGVGETDAFCLARIKGARLCALFVDWDLLRPGEGETELS